ncbi:MAG: hypothetical protein QOJ20_5399 [Mycobacterium sp.]|jgi:hypothetical protein|nr:hypothetical protein [Mycobacterium sp.]
MSAQIPEWLADAIVRARRGPHRADASEFSHGGGLTPPGLEDATEADGGRYRGRTLPVARDVRMARGTAGKPGGPWINGR